MNYPPVPRRWYPVVDCAEYRVYHEQRERKVETLLCLFHDYREQNSPGNRRKQNCRVVYPSFGGPNVQVAGGEDSVYGDVGGEEHVVRLDEQRQNQIVSTLQRCHLGQNELGVEGDRARVVVPAPTTAVATVAVVARSTVAAADAAAKSGGSERSAAATVRYSRSGTVAPSPGHIVVFTLNAWLTVSW